MSVVKKWKGTELIYNRAYWVRSDGNTFLTYFNGMNFESSEDRYIAPEEAEEVIYIESPRGWDKELW